MGSTYMSRSVAACLETRLHSDHLYRTRPTRNLCMRWFGTNAKAAGAQIVLVSTNSTNYLRASTQVNIWQIYRPVPSPQSELSLLGFYRSCGTSWPKAGHRNRIHFTTLRFPSTSRLRQYIYTIYLHGTNCNIS